MRAIAGLVLCILLTVPAVSVMAADEADYRDDFGSGDYSGNDGSLDFAGPWTEFGDTGGAGSGTVHIGSERCSNNECLHIEGNGLVVADYGLIRYADLSMFDHVDLSFDIQVHPQLGKTTSELWVEMFDGSKWTVVKTFELTNELNQHTTMNVTKYAGAKSAVRFRVPDVLSGGLVGLDLFFTGYATIDRVVLSGTLAPTGSTSTTSTTTPTTTSTTRPTTTTSDPSPSVTSAVGRVATISTAVSTGTGTGGASPGDAGVTTTTLGATRSTSGDGDTAGGVTTGPPPPDGPSSQPPVTGLRVTGGAVIADYQQGMMGDMDMTGFEVLGVDVNADFSMAVELFEAARVWIAGLTLVIAGAIIGGIDRKRFRG